MNPAKSPSLESLTLTSPRTRAPHPSHLPARFETWKGTRRERERGGGCAKRCLGAFSSEAAVGSTLIRTTAGVAMLLLSVLAFVSAQAAEERPYGIDHRIAWTNSHVIGSPEPPLPFTVEKTFTRLEWRAPMFITAEPGTDQLLVVLQGGEKERPSRVVRLRDDPGAERTEPFLEMNRRLIYSIAFHPDYRTNGFIFVFSNGPTPETERTNRVSRFTVERQPPFRCDPQSEHTIIEWHSQGHDGGGIVFGHDGMMYISTGDGTSDSDGWVSGQDLRNLNGGVLRIDVDHPGPGGTYSVPRDNPFVAIADARPEMWAYGLRNPWRMTIDEKTGQIWVGNNGQDLWETAHLIRRGENYGWSVYEGSHPFYLNRKLGPTPPVAPTIEHSHSELRSLTGGVVYYGDRFPELTGVYVYGDYSTGKILGARHDGTRLTWRRALAETQLAISSFGVDHHGELLITDHTGGAIYRLVSAPAQRATPKFPARLSETGLFVSTRDYRPDPALIPYSVNAPGWADGAEVQRHIALPGDSRIEYSSSGGWNFTNGAVLVQTLSLEFEKGNSATRRRIETRLMTRQNGQWAGYSYRWDESQSDARLVAAKGEEAEFTIRDASSTNARKQVWHFPSRAECMACHSRAANFVLGLSELQMNKRQQYSAAEDNQLRALQHVGLFTHASFKSPETMPKLANPYDRNEPVELRARSYLHANCSVCHVEAGGGNSKMELGFHTTREKMNLIGARPQHDTFGINNAMLIAPGAPDRSIIYQRLSRRGRGQMPPVVSAVVDERAVELMRDWIRSLPPEQKFVRDWTVEDLLPKLSSIQHGRSLESGRAAFREAGCIQCHRFAGDGGSVGPELTGVAKRLQPRDLLESILLPSKTIADGYATTEIETKSGDSFGGRVEREDDRVVVLRPLSAVDDPVTISKSDIRRRTLSKISNMPAGIVNTLTESQILDLLAYLLSEGQAGGESFAVKPQP